MSALKQLVARFKSRSETSSAPEAPQRPKPGGLKVGQMLAVPFLLVALILGALGVFAYRLVGAELNNANVETRRLQAERVAAVVSGRVQGLLDAVESAARDPRIASALGAADGAVLAQRSADLAAVVPGALRIRILPPAVEQPDTTAHPPLSYAGLDLVRQAASGRRPPAEVHFHATPDQHLAIARAIPGTGHVAGILFVSADTRLLEKWLASAVPADGYVELHQSAGENNLLLASAGRAISERAPDARITVADSAWEVAVWSGAPPSALSSGASTNFLVLFGVGALAVAAVFALFATVLGRLLHQDLVMLVRHVFNLLSRKREHAYTVRLAEFRQAVEALDEKFGLPRPHEFQPEEPKVQRAGAEPVQTDPADVLFLRDEGISVQELDQDTVNKN